MSENVLCAEKTVLFIIPWMEIGGADKFNLDLVAGLKRKGWKIIIVCTLKSKNPWLKEFERLTEDIWTSDRDDKREIGQALYDYMTQRKVDVVFLTNSLIGYRLLPWLKCVFPAIPIVDYVHCEELDWYKGGYPLFSAQHTLLLDHTIASSNHLVKWCIDNGADSGKISCCYTNVDSHANQRNFENRVLIRKSLGIEDRLPVILYVARLVEQKRPLLLVESISKLFSINKQFRCVIIGDGPYKDAVEKAIRKSPAKDNIVFLGSKTNEDVKKYMDAADVFFLPSSYEGIALSIYEAMAKELAIVATNTGGQKELVTEKCGTLLDYNMDNPAENYSKALSALIENPELCEAAGLAGKERVATFFPIEKMVNEIEAVLLSVPAKPRSTQDTGYAQLALLDKMLFLEKENEEMREKISGRLFRAASKMKFFMLKK